MKSTRQLIPAIVLCLLLVSCQSSGIIPLSNDTYMISKTDSGPLASLPRVQSEVMREVAAFAAQRGKIAVAVSTQSIPRAFGQFPHFEYQFRLMDRDDPRARGVTLTPRPDVVVQSTQNIEARVKVEGPDKSKGESVDLYNELTKLDELRKRGLLTEEEYEAEKKKLLARTP